MDRTSPEDSKPAASINSRAEGRRKRHGKISPRPKRPHSPEGDGGSTSPRKKQLSSSECTDQLTFPERLMQLITECHRPEHVKWIEEEEAITFRVDGFQSEVLDIYFQGLKYESFVRKLNRWYVYISMSCRSMCRHHPILSMPYSFLFDKLIFFGQCLLFSFLFGVHHRGFRRLTSEKISKGFVAYYHNSFRVAEQHLLRTMGIGKKNDPAVRNAPAFVGPHSQAETSAGALVGSRESSKIVDNGSAGAYSSTSSYATQQIPTLSGSPSPGATQSSSFSRSNSMLVTSNSALSNPQESKTDEIFAGALLSQLEFTSQHSARHSVLEEMLARQHQTYFVALQEREAEIQSENIRFQQQQQQQQQLQQLLLLQQQQLQQRINASLLSALAAEGNEELTRQYTRLTAAARLGTMGDARRSISQAFQQQQPVPPSHFRHGFQTQLATDRNLTTMFQSHRQQLSAASNAISNQRFSNDFGILGNQNVNAILAESAAPGAASFDNLVQILLEDRRRRDAQGSQGQPRQGFPSFGPPRPR